MPPGRDGDMLRASQEVPQRIANPDLGRRAPAAQTARGRLPVGTPGHIPSHSHIQIVPRDDDDFGEDYDDDFGEDYDDEDNTPVFRSPSLQYTPTDQSIAQHISHQYAQEPAAGKSFADMARRFARDPIVSEEKPTSGPISLAGLVKLQPNTRKKGNRNWRPLQLTDFLNDPSKGSTQVKESDKDEMRALAESLSNSSLEFASSQHPSSHMGASPFDNFDLTPLQTRDFSPLAQRSSMPTSGVDSVVGSGMYGSSEDISPTETRYSALDERVRLFGKTLPDPIRLHQEVGAFDGKVIYIGHPNRDVSAHQWSDQSYQWVNIGQYSHNRRRIEGSLASDRIRGLALAPNTLEYFKVVAEAREAQVKEHGRLERKGSGSTSMTELPASTFDEGDSYSGSSTLHLHSLPQMDSSGSKATSAVPQAKKPAIRTVARDYLEDPFVGPSAPVKSTASSAFNFTANRSGDSAPAGNGMFGALDIDYKFPIYSDNTATSHIPVDLDSQRRHSAKLEEDQFRRHLFPEILQPQPHASFTGETVGGLEASARRPTLTQSYLRLSPEDVQKRQVLKDRLAELVDSSARDPGPSLSHRIAVPNMRAGGPQTASRSAYPPGLTIANPNRVVSTLNAAAPPYNHRGSFTQTVGESESEATTATLPASLEANLHFSEPDGARKSAVHTIVNGSDHQMPTPQNLRGPYRFFQDNVPTTNDPSVSLTASIQEDEKLQNWFRDGQRPARIEEHWKSMLATESSNARNVGVIGQRSVAAENAAKYENTPIFMRLFETLQQYKDDSRAFSGGSDYFTRAFKAVPSHLKDEGSDGDNSFFGEDYGASIQPRRTLDPGPPMNFGAPSGAGYFGFASSPGFNTAPLGRFGFQGLRQDAPSIPPPDRSNIRTKNEHGVIADGGFGP